MKDEYSSKNTYMHKEAQAMMQEAHMVMMGKSHKKKKIHEGGSFKLLQLRKRMTNKYKKNKLRDTVDFILMKLLVLHYMLLVLDLNLQPP